MDNEKILNFWTEVKNILKKTSDKFDVKWQKRKRVLNTQLLVAIILKLVQSKNRQGYGSTLIQFWEVCAEKNIELPQLKSISASSLCEARQKLSEDIFKELNQELINCWQKHQELPTWNGHRIFAVDGSRINLPRELINDGYKLYAKERGRYYPQGLMSCLYNLQEKVIYEESIQRTVSKGEKEQSKLEFKKGGKNDTNNRKNQQLGRAKTSSDSKIKRERRVKW